MSLFLRALNKPYKCKRVNYIIAVHVALKILLVLDFPKFYFKYQLHPLVKCS